jgi:transposase-like protein
MGDCGCNKGKEAVQPIKPARKIEGIITKKTCPKCSYWMSLVISPSTKEKNYKCQNTLCKHSMLYLLSQPSQSPLLSL